MVDFNEPGSSRERAPVVKRDAAPASRPTPAPLRRAHGEAAMLRMRAETFDEAMEERAAAGDVIVGPFEARDAAEAEQLKRALLSDKEAVRKLQQRQADLESPLRPRARALAKEAMQAVEALERRGQTAELQRRQSQDEQRCFVGNDKLSCYPTNGLQVVQGQWSKFIWNTNYPEFTNNGGFVDVYLFHQDSDLIATSWTSLPNAQGRLSFSPNDPYWERRTAAANFTGQNITWPFYFVVTSSGFGLGGETTRLSTWTAVQTALPKAIAASRSEAAASASAAALSSSLALASASATATLTGAAASAASSSAAAASSSVAASFTSALISSLTAAGLTGTETTRGVLTTTLSNGQIVTASATVRANGIPIAPQSDDSGLPKYAIALIAVFGFLALVAAIVGLYFLMAAARRRRRQQASHAGSDSPMMRGIDGTASVAGTDVYSDAGAAAALRRSTAGEESSPFSTDEATRMADAFRAALRKPAFDETVILAGSPDGDSPGEQDTGRALLREELKSEGREVQNVGERKTPTIGGQ